jgi:ATP-dependent RNA helicase DeaD
MDHSMSSETDAASAVAEPQRLAPLSPSNSLFAALGLEPSLVEVVSELGYEEPTAIQREAIPPLLAGHDVLGQAATGTGKTAAFALPLLQRIGRAEGRATVRALVLVPTRELAMQVAEAVHRYGRGNGVSVLPIYGGQDIQQQLRALKRGIDVVVATPGRALDHIGRGTLKLDQVSVVVLDEADEMLDMGFAEDLEAILVATPAERQTALFSATLPARILGIAKRHMRDAVRVMIAREKVAAGTAPRVREVAYVVQRRHKPQALARVLDMEGPTSAIIFCRTRTEVDELTETLSSRGYSAGSLHGGLSQDQRDRVMRRFREGATELLVATDVAARGLDIDHVSHVVNYDVPASPDAYVHRVGRTGRAGREGVAITLAEAREHRQLKNIEGVTKRRIAVETVPTIHDLRVHRLELIRASLEEVLLAGELESFRVVVEALSGEHDVVDIAAAAVKLLRAAEGGDESEEEIPIAVPAKARDRNARNERGEWKPRAERRAEAPESAPLRETEAPPRADRGARAERPERPERSEHPERSERAEGGKPPKRGAFKASKEKSTRPPEKLGRREARGRGRPGQEHAARIFVGVGRIGGIRPADIVGAIANEAGVDSSEIGAIDITDRFSLVEVPDAAADHIVRVLRGTTIRGKRVTVRRDGART